MTAPESHDVSDALRDAQKSLRQTRSFSHPFYWAGLQVETRLGVEAPVKQR
jgi:CHAT domain-containing protein